MTRMVPLKLYRDNSLGFPDLLNRGAVVADGVVLNKDGSLLAGWFYRGQDLATVSEAERNRVSSVVSGALSKLGSGWMLYQDAIRKPAWDYPDEAENAFLEARSVLLDAERRAQFQAGGAHYESFYGCWSTKHCPTCFSTIPVRRRAVRCPPRSANQLLHWPYQSWGTT